MHAANSSNGKLGHILGEQTSERMDSTVFANDQNGSDIDESYDYGVIEGMCVECTDQPLTGLCQECKECFCDVCYQALHHGGKRRMHHFQRSTPISTVVDPKVGNIQDHSNFDHESDAGSCHIDHDRFGSDLGDERLQNPEWFINRSKYIPLRLTYEERKYFRLLEATLNVSDYTEKVDIFTFGQRPKRMSVQIKSVCAILSGLAIAHDYNEGQKLLKDHNYVDNAEFFQDIFEIGRRYKINNPDKMRSDFGKLIYMLQDAVSPHVQELLSFNCVKPIRTVYELLKNCDCLNLLEDGAMTMATMEIIPENKSRSQVSTEIRNKESAQDYLAEKYSSPNISKEQIKHCLYSIGDNHSFLRSNRDACDKMLNYLKKYFQPEQYQEPYVLAIKSGKSGARLSHSHRRHYHYVLQSLTLWREVLHELFMLWYFAEQDMLDPSLPYRLCDTGQGLNRLQSCPRVSRAIHKILARVQASVGEWVGSSVVHLGDHNVPNPLFFVTKYLSVAPILNPIVLCLEGIDRLANNPQLLEYLDARGGTENIKKEILCDFFKHAFDGSGADSFFDAGSCIDGRFTSAWNWCNQIEKKPYFHVFLLTGFVGFDGEV